MKRVLWASLRTADERRRALARPALASQADLSTRVRALLQVVKEKGDIEVLRLTREYDRADLASLELSREEIQAAAARVDPALLRAIDEASLAIEAFHERQMPSGYSMETRPGVRCEKKWLPLPSVGLYAPGGSATLLSTVLMLAIPARIAGCAERVLATPPGPDGELHPALLAAALRAGVTRVFRMGGAQAIGAMAYGTASVPRVAKLFGPGNAWVTEAKVQVSRDPDGAAIDMPAGPSEVFVIADESADPRFVASDLLSQAEHGADSQCVLASPSARVLDAVSAELLRQLETLPRREIAKESLSRSLLLETADLASAMEASNLYAPEHLILQVRDAASWAPKVESAGSVFLGAYSPETAGDYASGTNHVLPTYGYARAYGGLGVESFLRPMTVQELTKEGLAALAPTLLSLARAEGLEAHARAVEARL